MTIMNTKETAKPVAESVKENLIVKSEHPFYLVRLMLDGTPCDLAIWVKVYDSPDLSRPHG